MSHTSIILNGTVIEQKDYTEGIAPFYEIIRVNNRAPMFLEDHIQRLNHSLKKANIAKTVTIQAVQSDLARLFAADGVKDQNVRLSVSVESDQLHCALYYVDAKYLKEETYKKGVPVKTQFFERENPEIKQVTKAMQLIRKQLQTDSVYEYLLVDRAGLILEGTKTNVFFVKGSEVFTADPQKVLGGITRHHVAALVRKHYLLRESALAKINVQEVDAVFLTGTSISILPVCKVDDISFNSANNPVVLLLMQAYAECEKNYIATHQLPAGCP